MKSCPFCGGTYMMHKKDCYMYVHLTAAPNVDIIHMAWDRRVDPARDLLDRFRQLKQYHKGTYVTLNVHIDLIRDLEAYYARDSESGLP